MITLNKDGIRYTNGYNPDCDKYINRMVDSLIPHLREEVVLSDDYTLEDLFKILEGEIENYNMIFGSDLGHYPLSSYIDDINKDAEVPDDIDFLEVRWICQCSSYSSTKNEDETKELQFYPDFHGWGEWEDDDNTPFPKGTKGGIAIEYTPLAELKKLLLKITTKTKVFLDDGITYDKDENGDLVSKVLFEGDRYFSVFDFISAILYEISWAGSPDIRDEEIIGIEKDFEEVKKDIADGKTESFTSWEELKKELEL